MNMTRSRSRRVNDGNYGHVEFFASVTMNHQDLGYSDEEWLALVKDKGTKAAKDLLADTVSRELEAAVDEEAAEALTLLEKYSTSD